VLAFVALLPSHSSSQSAPFLGTKNNPAVSVIIDLHNADLHPRQLVYDAQRDGLWFWTSTQDKGVTFDNRVYFYDLGVKSLRSWPIYAPDWSSQLLAGLAVAPDGDVWIGWHLHLVVFHPADGSYQHYELPARPRYPLSAAVLGDLPANLGIAGLAVASDGTVWIARYAALSLTSFNPTNATFNEHLLPASAGDPAKLAIGPAGHILFTTNLSANHPGYINEMVGEYDPQSGQTRVYPQAADAIAITKQGDLYVAAMDGQSGQGASLVRLSASARANAASTTTRQTSLFARGIVPFAVDGTALTTDHYGRVWTAVAGKPDIAVFDPATGRVQQFQYAAPSMAAHPAYGPAGFTRQSSDPQAVWLTHTAAMTTDGAGHLWYIRAGSDTIEEVAA
jgi:sugar lactone lactonase YvrE